MLAYALVCWCVVVLSCVVLAVAALVWGLASASVVVTVIVNVVGVVVVIVRVSVHWYW